MASSFTVNKHDLEYILQQIKIAEMHAGGMELSDAIAEIYGVSRGDAALLPAGLRTVDGSMNNLLSGNEKVGASLETFPRLLDPVYMNDTDGDGIDFDGAGPSPARVQGDYGAVDEEGHVGTGDVIDADPRTISNLIVTQDVSNPVAIRAALERAGIEGNAATSAVNAITSAYNATLNARGANATVNAAQAKLEAANAANATAGSALTEATERLSSFTDALDAANAVRPLVLTAQFTAGLLNQALRAIPTDVPTPPAPFTAPEPTLADFTDTTDNPTPDEQAAFDAAHAQWAADLAAYQAALDAFEADPATLAYTSAVDAARVAYQTALDAANAVDDAADAVQSALGANNTPEAAALGVLTEMLVSELGGLVEDGLTRDDLRAAVTARQAFVGDGSGQTTDAVLAADASIDALEGLVSSAEAAVTSAASAAQSAAASANAAQIAYDAAVASANTAGTPAQAAAFLAGILEDYGIEVAEDGGLFIQNISPDVGLSPSFNTYMTIFGQFFDHGLDLVNKGGNGTVYIPLEADDPLIAGADKVFGTADDLPQHLRFMALTRATPTWDADGTAQHTNATTPWVDQNQTYTSHASHQVFIREYVRKDIGDGEKTYSTGRLLDGTAASGSKDGTIANWGEVKVQALEMLGIRLQDTDVHRVPLLLTDQYGNLILGPNGYAQMVMAPDANHDQNWLREGTAQGITTEGSLASGVAFLADIAHNAVPSAILDDNGVVIGTALPADGDSVIGNQITTNNRGQNLAYDNELLDKHFLSGDGRGNENIGLTAVHTIFHSEHNRVLEADKHTILESGDRAFINEWLLVDIAPGDPIPTDVDALEWDGARLFQAARFSTEMQYQHMVFEEFARRIQPMVDPFVFTNTAEIDGSIVAEFAHTVYRFGHSMLNGSVDRLDNNLDIVGGDAQLSLIEAFLNPMEYLAGGSDVDEIQASLIRGMSQDIGNEIDEFVTPALRSNLLGLPLDLAALNIARGRETGVPSLNETREQLYNDFGLADLKPYASWSDFTQNLKNPLSVINFIAAYGSHETIEAAETLAEKRAAATLLVLGDTDIDGDGVADAAPSDRTDFLNARGIYASQKGGLDTVDLWIGGLAEKLNEFGGMLGSTFNFIFEYQMERLQNGDRLYYLSRVQGLNLLDSLEQNTFTDIVMRNSALGDKYSTHLNGSLFTTPDMILELDRGIAQADYNGSLPGKDPVWEDDILQSIDPKVVRDYSTSSTVDGSHDLGGYLKFRGGEHVVLGGTEGNDTLIGDLGIDALWGDGGDDYLNAGQESDEVFGGDGDDIIEDPFGDNFLRGNDGNDVVSAARGFNLLFGNEGKDALLLGQDGSEAFGGEGDDYLLGGAGADNLLGGEGDDWIEGGEGFDVISGDNSELFFNSTIIGHDVAWGHGNDQDYDLESGDDIAFSGPGIQRFEGMFGFDWAIAKYDVAGVNYDMAVPFFATDQANILRDRFDQMEGFSGWRYDDILRGDDRGQILGGDVPGGTPETSFSEHVLTTEGIARIDGLDDWFDGALITLFGSVQGANPKTYRDGNILMGGDGSDIFEGRGGYDVIDGDSWLNVRIRIVKDGVEYTAESMTSDTVVAGPRAGKVYNVETGDLAFGGRSLTSLLLDRTINPGDMEIVRELKAAPTPDDDIDVAIYRGGIAEYVIEGRGIVVDLNGDGDLNDEGEDVLQEAYDVNGDGFIAIHDLDNGQDGATVNGTQLRTRGVLTDDTDLIRNIEQLQFNDLTVTIFRHNDRATGTVTIDDITPSVGQVLTATLANPADGDGLTLDATGLPVGLTFDWQIQKDGRSAWTTIASGTDGTYTVETRDLDSAIRAVAVFSDTEGNPERIASAGTTAPTISFSVDENARTDTVIAAVIPVSAAAGSPLQWHVLQDSVDGRFKVLQTGTDLAGNPIFGLFVASDNDPSTTADNIDFETQSKFMITIDTYDFDPAVDPNAAIVDTREFTIHVNDVEPETAPVAGDISWIPVMPGAALPGAGEVLAQLSGGGAGTFSLLATSSPNISLTAEGALSSTSALGRNETYRVDVSFDGAGGELVKSYVIRTGSNQVDNAISGSLLNEVTYGEGRNDTLDGGLGDDVLFGQNGSDRLVGGLGNDVLAGGAGIDSYAGGDGDDTVLYKIGDGIEFIDGGAGTDRFSIHGTSAAESITVNFNGKTIVSTSVTQQLVGIEEITLDLGGGGDTLNYEATSAGIVVDLSAGQASGFVSIANIANVFGTASADILTAGSGANQLRGGQGDDIFIATVDDARDEFLASGGVDLADFSAYTTALDIDLGEATTIARGTGSSDATSDVLVGIRNIIGGSGDDRLVGANGVNELFGGGGNDTLDGAVGRDTLTGGDGDDVFLFATAAETGLRNGADVILDFGDNDRIDVSLFAPNAQFIGTAARFDANATNQIRYSFDGTDTMIHIDTDTDRGVEAEIRLMGQYDLNVDDFILIA